MSTVTTTTLSPPAPDTFPKSTGSSGSRSPLDVCPDGHLLTCKVVSGGLLGLNLKKCMRCNCQLRTAQTRHSCKLCGFHLCQPCWSLWMSRDAPRLLASPARSSSAAAACVPCSPGPPLGSGSRSISGSPSAPLPACKYGSACYQKSAWHLSQFAHPGDRSYRKSLVFFSNGQKAEFENLWQLFHFHDQSESQNLTREEFEAALQSCSQLMPSAEMVPDSEEAWKEAGGPNTGFVNFGQFATLVESFGLRLPLGLEKSGATRPCRFRVRLQNNDEPGGEEYTCSCPCFEVSKHGGGGELCSCGHKLSMHRSDFAEDTYSNIEHQIQMPWRPGEEGLVKVTDAAVLEKLQTLLHDTHKTSDNWTRDRGCRLHGVHGCSWSCAAKNRCAVPTSFSLMAAFRNQSPELWHKYSLMKQAIRLECGRERYDSEEFQSMPLVSAVELDAKLDLDKDCNEWRCFHGSAPENLRGICSSNFRPVLAGTGATWKDPGATKGTPLYGFGFYFAERITKADEYAQPLPPGDEHANFYAVSLCRVIGGRTKVVTNNDIDVDGLRAAVFDGPYHSVFGDRVASLGKPFREAVVYDKDQCYPEFLLIYSRNYD